VRSYHVFVRRSQGLRALLREVVLSYPIALLAVAAEVKPVKVDVRGKITELSAADAAGRKAGRLGFLRVEGVKEKDTDHDKAAVTVTARTRIEKRVGEKRKPAKFADLKKGAKVEVTFTGAAVLKRKKAAYGRTAWVLGAS